MNKKIQPSPLLLSMFSFKSKREKRLWIIVAVLVLTIWSTLGMAQEFAEFLRSRNLLRISFGIGLCSLVGVAIWQWRKSKPGWKEILIAIGIGFVYLALMARIETPEERTHLIEYSVVAAVILRALNERNANGGSVKYPMVFAWLTTVGLGVLDEGIQWLLPNRVFDWIDIGFNICAATLAIGTATIFKLLKHFAAQKSS